MKKIISILLVVLLPNISFSSKLVPNEGFAELVKPLLPTVANIYSKKKVSSSKSQKNLGDFFQEFNELFERFGKKFEEFDNPVQKDVTAMGSGFIIDKTGYIVTNHHVVEGADEINIKLHNSQEYQAKLIGSDKRTDIALLKIQPKQDLPYVNFGDSTKSRIGDYVITIGNPFGLGGTVTSGIISSKGRDIEYNDGSNIVDNLIQTDAAINVGNSGGPMFNTQGEVIGINTIIIAPSGGNVGIGFAIPSVTAKIVINQLKESGQVKRGILNVKIQDISKEVAEGLGLKDKEGVSVAEVIKGGSAHKAGIKPGDIITEFNNVKITNARKLQVEVANYPVGKLAHVTIIRNGTKLILKVIVNEDHVINTDTSNKDKFEIANLILSPVNSEIKQKYDLEEGDNIVITSIKSQSFISSNLKVGDVVVAANNKTISKISELKKLVEECKIKNKKSIVLQLKRKNIRMFIALPIDKK